MSAECTSIIIDGSHSLINDNKFDQIVDYLEFTFTEKLKKSRKTDWVSLLLSNSTITENDYSIDDIVSLCTCEAPITSKIVIDCITQLKKFNNIDKFREFDADGHCILRTLLITNISMQENFKKRKMLRQILIFGGNWNQLSLYDDEYALVVDQLKGVKLILVNCNDKFDKSTIENDTLWGRILHEDGITYDIFDLSDLRNLIDEPIIRTIKPVRVFSGQLRFGAKIETIVTEKYDLKEQCFNDKNSICIQVEGFPATKAISNIGRKIMVHDETTDSYISAKSVIEYEIKKNNNMVKEDKDTSKEQDSNEEYSSVSYESITKGYRYGSEYVILPSTLVDEMPYITVPGIDIRGFTHKDNFPRHYLTSDATFIMADTKIGSIADSTAFTALVDGMLRLDQFAVARYVGKKMSEVEMCVLVPHLISDRNLNIKIEKAETKDSQFIQEGEGEEEEPIRVLILTRLPFAEDERLFFTPKLVNRRTTSGKPIKPINNESEIDLLMSRFIDSMDTTSLTNIPEELYFKKLSNTPLHDDSTLPLPAKKNQEYAEDPLAVPSISMYRMNQKIQNWVNQVLIEKKDTMEISEMPSKIRNKLKPRQRELADDGVDIIPQLVKLLNLKKVVKQDFSSHKESQITYEKGKPIEELLKLGNKDES